MPNAYKVADSLLVLRNQLNAIAPGRSKRSDGFVGDAAHQSRDSDHNPWWVHGGHRWVTAGDFTQDSHGGLNCVDLAEALQDSRDPRIKYVIWQRQIMAGRLGPKPWVWRPYNGPNPHAKHLHLSVVPEPVSLTTTYWNLAGLVKEENMSPEAVWSHPVRDLYWGEGRTFRAVEALEWAAVHGGTNKDMLTEVQIKLEDLQKEQDEQRTLLEAIALKVGVTPA